MVIAAALLAAASAVSPAGLYHSDQIEVGAALELQKNGHFRYQLDYGAVSEEGQGDWSFDGKTVRLTSRPMPKTPTFELIRDGPAPLGEVLMTLEPPGFGQNFRLDAVGTDAATGEKAIVTSSDDGRVDSGGHKLAEIDPLVPVYGTIGGQFPLSQDRGHHLILRFHANDLGHAGFNREPLAFTSRGLVLTRYGTEIRFVRVRP